MRTVEVEAASLEEARRRAAEELGVDEAAMVVTVVSESGFLGIGRKVRIRASIEEPHTEETDLVELVTHVVDALGVDGKVAGEEQEDVYVIRVDGQDVGRLIGRHGQTLEALQYLVSVVAHRKAPESRRRVVIEVGDYLERRRRTIEEIAERAARRAVELGREVTIRPMRPWERRIVHLTLRDREDVETLSEGEEPERYVVVRPT